MFRFFLRQIYRRKFAGTEFESLYLSPHKTEKVSVDCELTQTDIEKAEIVSIGAVIIKGNSVLKSKAFYRKIKTPSTLSGESIKVHGYRKIDLENGMELKDALLDFVRFIGNRPLTGYYLKMDEKILEKYLKRYFDLKLLQPHHEISSMFHAAYGHKFEGQTDLTFENILKCLKIPSFARHTALGDAIVAGIAFLALSRKN